MVELVLVLGKLYSQSNALSFHMNDGSTMNLISETYYYVRGGSIVPE